jgi:transcriptional regulator of acetoin/glycerol metabolism
LGREGLRVRGHPVGIENAAYLRLAEYSFPADDAELSSLVIRLVARCSGDTVRVSDLDRMPLPKPSGDLPPSRPRKDPLSA